MKSVFSLRLGELRRERNISQRKAALDLGVSQAVLSHYENDIREPKFELIPKLCTYYEVTADYLLGLTDQRKDSATILSELISEKLHLLEELREMEKQVIEELKTLCASESYQMMSI